MLFQNIGIVVATQYEKPKDSCHLNNHHSGNLKNFIGCVKEYLKLWYTSVLTTGMLLLANNLLNSLSSSAEKYEWCTVLADINKSLRVYP
jgi:hypothetical protein